MNEIIQSKISDHDRIKLEISNRKITGKKFQVLEN